MDLKLGGKVALVTGGSRGIGAAVSLSLGRQGCDVALTCRGRIDAAGEVARQIEALGRRALALKTDVTDFAAAAQTVTTVVEKLGRLGLLVCNAGIAWGGAAWRMTEEPWAPWL